MTETTFAPPPADAVQNSEEQEKWFGRLIKETPATFEISQGDIGFQLKIYNLILIDHSIPTFIFRDLDVDSVDRLIPNQRSKSIGKFVNDRALHTGQGLPDESENQVDYEQEDIKSAFVGPLINFASVVNVGTLDTDQRDLEKAVLNDVVDRDFNYLVIRRGRPKITRVGESYSVKKDKWASHFVQYVLSKKDYPATTLLKGLSNRLFGHVSELMSQDEFRNKAKEVVEIFLRHHDTSHIDSETVDQLKTYFPDEYKRFQRESGIRRVKKFVKKLIPSDK